MEVCDSLIMATMKFKGLDKFIEQIERLEADTSPIFAKTLYNGAEVMADAIKSSINGIVPDDTPYNPNRTKTGPTSVQIEGLAQSFGISPMRTTKDEMNVKLGFDGYNSIRSTRWPKGQPNAMVARSVESGTSWMTKQPFIARTQKAMRQAVEEKMKITLEKEIEARVDK